MTSEQDEQRTQTAPTPAGKAPLSIKGTEGMVVSFPKCCHPIPGDPILGLISTGRGIVIHLKDCKNLVEFRNHPEKWIDVEWEKDIDAEFAVEIRLEVNNQRGVLATIANAIADQGANIEDIDTTTTGWFRNAVIRSPVTQSWV